MDGLSLIGIDDQNRLYWDGNRLATLTLTRWQKLGAIAVTASAVIGAAAAVISATASPSGRFQVSDVGGQILRVDTTTGEARECTLNDERKVVCMAVFNRDGIFAPAHSSARP